MGIGYTSNCFGFILGIDAGISGLLGLAFTGTIADLELGCKQMFPIGSVPPASIEIGFIDSIPPTFLVEVTAGASSSVGLPGCLSCNVNPI